MAVRSLTQDQSQAAAYAAAYAAAATTHAANQAAVGLGIVSSLNGNNNNNASSGGGGGGGTQGKGDGRAYHSSSGDARQGGEGGSGSLGGGMLTLNMEEAFSGPKASAGGGAGGGGGSTSSLLGSGGESCAGLTAAVVHLKPSFFSIHADKTMHDPMERENPVLVLSRGTEA